VVINVSETMAFSPDKGQPLDNLPVFALPWIIYNCYGFFLVFEISNFRQINSMFRLDITFELNLKSNVWSWSSNTTQSKINVLRL